MPANGATVDLRDLMRAILAEEDADNNGSALHGPFNSVCNLLEQQTKRIWHRSSAQHVQIPRMNLVSGTGRKSTHDIETYRQERLRKTVSC